MGKVFTGYYIGDYNRGDPESSWCYRIAIDYRRTSEGIMRGLDAIEYKFDGRIWTGLFRDVLYIRQADHPPYVTQANRFKIVGFKGFEFQPYQFKEARKYRDCCCFYFVLQPLAQ